MAPVGGGGGVGLLAVGGVCVLNPAAECDASHDEWMLQGKGHNVPERLENETGRKAANLNRICT